MQEVDILIPDIYFFILFYSALMMQITEREALVEQDRQRQKAIEEAHRQATIEGMQVAKDAGQHIGRPQGTTDSDYKILAKYLDVVEALNEGLSLRTIASKTKKSVNTIRKVKAILDEIG